MGGNQPLVRLSNIRITNTSVPGPDAERMEKAKK
jgi:hypothetical protein